MVPGDWRRRAGWLLSSGLLAVLSACTSTQKATPPQAGVATTQPTSGVAPPGPGSGQPLSSAGDLYGTWTLTQLASDPGDGSAATPLQISGAYSWIFRLDGTYFYQLKGYSDGSYDQCSAVGSGQYSVVNGAIKLTDRAIVPYDGTCPGAFVGENDLDDLKGTITATGDGVRVMTFPVGDGSNRHYTVARKGQETWNGLGIDPRFFGAFQVSQLIQIKLCNNNDTLTDEPLGGQAQYTFNSDGTELEVYAGFTYAPSQQACSGTADRTFTVNRPFGINLTYQDSSNDCSGNGISDGHIDGAKYLYATTDGGFAIQNNYDDGTCVKLDEGLDYNVTYLILLKPVPASAVMPAPAPEEDDGSEPSS